MDKKTYFKVTKCESCNWFGDCVFFPNFLSFELKSFSCLCGECIVELFNVNKINVEDLKRLRQYYATGGRIL